MPSLVLKKIPPRLHARLRQEAARHRRSMTGEAIHVLEQGLGLCDTDFPEPHKGKKPLTQKMIDRAVRQGRS